MACPVEDDDHAFVSHAEFVARRHRRLRVTEAFKRLVDDDPSASPVVEPGIERDAPTAGSPQADKDEHAPPLAFPKRS
jgi:hypothetical protein